MLPDEPLNVLHEIQAERDRQRAKGYDAAHDDTHAYGEIIRHPQWGAIARLSAGPDRAALLAAAAMIVAEVERIDRAGYRARAGWERRQTKAHRCAECDRPENEFSDCKVCNPELRD